MLHPAFGRWGQKLHQFDVCLAPGHPHHDNGALDVVQADHPIYRRSFHVALAEDFESQVDKKRLGSSQIVHDDAHMIDAPDLHVVHPSFHVYHTGDLAISPAASRLIRSASTEFAPTTNKIQSRWLAPAFVLT